jgi:hypothetical protein
MFMIELELRHLGCKTQSEKRTMASIDYHLGVKKQYLATFGH